VNPPPRSASPNPEEPIRSPLRPQRPEEPTPSIPASDAPAHEDRWETEPRSPQERLQQIREKMETVANEYANQQISKAQFNAIYAHYAEQRTLIEGLVARNPNNEAWKQASRSGKTSFLRSHFEGRPLNYVIYLHNQPRPLMGGGTRPDTQKIAALLKQLWSLEKRKIGLARFPLANQLWLVMAAGLFGVTFVTFHLEPSGEQFNHVNDLHLDFERANRYYLEREKTRKDQMVFPQRGLLEKR